MQSQVLRLKGSRQEAGAGTGCSGGIWTRCPGPRSGGGTGHRNIPKFRQSRVLSGRSSLVGWYRLGLTGWRAALPEVAGGAPGSQGGEHWAAACPGSKDHSITESQRGRGWKATLWITQSNPLPKSLSCRWAPLKRVSPHAPDTHP